MTDMFWEISSNILYAVLIALGGILCHQLKHLITIMKTLQSGLKSVLRNDIMNVHERVQRQGGIYPYQLENADHMYVDYRRLGGNGVVERIMEEIRDTKILKETK